jgi:hypothetical protein
LRAVSSAELEVEDWSPTGGLACFLHLTLIAAQAPATSRSSMHRNHHIRGFALVSCLALGVGGCRDKETVPPVEVQSQATQPANQPTTITGCLKAGEAPDTFVVAAAQAQGSGETATYQIVGTGGTNLTDHVGRQVEVTGVVRQVQELASRSRTPAAESRGTAGTGATATVETRTEVDIKHLEVSTVKPLGQRCE